MFARYSPNYGVLIASAVVLMAGLSLRADDLSVTGNLTIAGDTDLRGPVSFGRLTEDITVKGFNVDVSQETHFHNEEVWVGDSTGTTSSWVEEGYYGQLYGYVTIYSSVNHPYWVPAVYDEFGVVIEEGHYMDDYVSEAVGQEWQVINENAWIVTGGHYDYSQYPIPAHYESVSVQTFDAPQVRFSATRSNTAWVWRNPGSSSSGDMRELMVLSTGGLSFPAPNDSTGTSRSLLTHANFEQSYTSPQVLDSSYQSFGSKVGKDKIEVWDHVGHTVAGSENNGTTTIFDSKSENTLAPFGLTLSYGESDDGGNTMHTTTTTVTATSASFGGSVTVNGPVTLAPQGDLNMGAFTHQAQN